MIACAIGGNQSQPNGQLSAVLEALGIADRVYQGTCCDRANARYLRQLPARRALTVPRLDLGFQFDNLSIQFLLQVRRQALQQLKHRAWQTIFCIFQYFRHSLDDVGYPLGNDDAKLP